MKTDSLFYELFQTCPSLLFELIDDPNPNADGYTFRSIELKQTAFRIDGVFLLEARMTDAPVYLLEVQFQRDEQLYARLFTEAILFLRQNPIVQQWHVVMMFGNRSCEPKEAGAFASLLSLPEVHIIYLDEIAEVDTESVELSLIRLIVEPQRNAIVRAQQLVERARNSPSRLSSSVIIEMIETIIVYKFPNLSWQEVEVMFGLSELKQTRVYQQGREEGREEGRENEARSLILRQLTRRVGSLSTSLVESINTLSVEALEELGEALLDFTSIEDVNRWLSANASQSRKQS
ncbi:MAG: Rpn family recombination-promoting nuclease/putative transposase [Cyanobacteria bacterium J06633_2]